MPFRECKMPFRDCKTSFRDCKTPFRDCKTPFRECKMPFFRCKVPFWQTNRKNGLLNATEATCSSPGYSSDPEVWPFFRIPEGQCSATASSPW